MCVFEFREIKKSSNWEIEQSYLCRQHFHSLSPDQFQEALDQATILNCEKEYNNHEELQEKVSYCPFITNFSALYFERYFISNIGRGFFWVKMLEGLDKHQ